MSADAPSSGLLAWVRDRVAWTGITDALSEHRAPRRSFFFYLGGITGFLLLIQVITGILLTVYYRPDAAHAHESVESIVGEIAYGHLVRAVHVWSSISSSPACSCTSSRSWRGGVSSRLTS